ncbi:MAG: hypothetical protein LBQ68_04745 [Clostridiales bacterium]|jgi:hypothetical protein|nr:hypothetical protein [Clostridiales bacterium]
MKKIMKITDEHGSITVQLTLIMITITMLVTVQFSITAAEYRMSNLHRRYAGLYNLAADMADTYTEHLNNQIEANLDEIISLCESRLDPESSDFSDLTKTAEDIFQKEAINLFEPTVSESFYLSQDNDLNIQIFVSTSLLPNNELYITVLTKNLTHAGAGPSPSEVSINALAVWENPGDGPTRQRLILTKLTRSDNYTS